MLDNKIKLLDKKIYLAIFILLSISLLTTPMITNAAEGAQTFLEAAGVKDGALIPKTCLENGICGLNEMFQTIVNFSQIILALTGSIALLMFIYSGLMFIIGGAGVGGNNADRINTAKAAMKAAIVGLVIIFGSWLIVNMVIGSLTNGEIHSPAKIFDNFWYEAPSG